MYSLTDEQKAKNAIKWIENLPNYKQADKGERGILGGIDRGYCCIGAGCAIVGVEFEEHVAYSEDFKKTVGLVDMSGFFKKEGEHPTFFEQKCLTDVNDYTDAGFKRIANLMKTFPDWIFEKEVAKLINKHFA